MSIVNRRHLAGNFIIFPAMQSSHHFRYQTKLKIRDIEDDAEKMRRLRGLPKGLQLPYEVRHPWMRPVFEEDFVLITEFSENEGPREVLTIPSNGGGAFDKNAFALHVMSVDFQSQNRTADFSISEDTQMVLSDKKTGMCAFVHHFTLYDIHARGYVRPFCMSYITDSKRKILTCMSSIVREFQKIARVFHKGNRIAFGADLEQRMSDLCSINDQLNRTQWMPESQTGGQLDEKTVTVDKQKEIYQQTFCETKKVINALKPHLHDPLILEKLKKLENQADIQFKQETTQETHQPAEIEGAEQEEAENIRINLPGNPQFGSDFAMRKAHSLSSLDDLKTDSNETVSFKSFAPTYLKNMKQLRNLHELCGLGTKEGINRLRNFAQKFSQEEIAIAIENTEGSLVDPSKSLLSLGRNVVLNFTSSVDLKKHMNAHAGKGIFNQLFISVLQRKLSLGSGGSCCSTDSFKSCLDDTAFDSRRSSDGTLPRFFPSASINADLHSEGYDTFDSDTTPETPTSEFSHIQFDSSSQDNLSLGSYHIVDDDFLHINESRQGFLTRKSHSLENLPSMTTNDKNYGNQSKSKGQVRISSSVGLVEKMYGVINDEATKVKSIDISPPRIEENKNRESKKPLHLAKPIKKKLKIEREGSGKSSLKRPCHHTRNESPPLRCYAEEVCRPPDTQSGVSSILEFRNNYSAGVHLIYALLIARPVVILAKPEHQREVRSLIATLWMFVSDTNSCYGRAVIPWRKQSLHITDLPCLRLVGLCKSSRCRIPKSVERYVSILDYDTGVIVSPPYKGVFLKAVFSYRNSWPSNSTFLAFIHSLFLELACKAYVLYYTRTLGPGLVQHEVP